MDIELHLVACMMSDPRIIERVSMLISTSDFSRREVGMLFDALVVMHRDGRPVGDFAFVNDALPKILGSGVLSRDALRNAIVECDVANHVHYCDLIRTNSQRMSFAAVLNQAMDRLQRGESVDVPKLMDHTSVQIDECRKKLLSADDEHIGSSLRREAEWLVDESADDSGSFVPTGFSVLDDRGAGLVKPGLVIVGGSTGAGKTSLVTQWCELLARQGMAVYSFSMEMARHKLSQRILSQNGISMSVWQNKFGVPSAIRQQLAELARQTSAKFDGYRYKVNDRTFDFETVIRRARAEAATCGLDCIVVDHAGLVKFREAGKKARHEVLYELARNLKVLSGELGIMVILVSQFSQHGIATRDLSEDVWDSCKTITQNADAAFLLHKLDDKNKDNKDKRLLWVQKSRNSEKEFGVHLQFDGSHQLFKECSDVVFE